MTAASHLRRATHRVRAAASADGAGGSGLAALIGAHALQAAGDALVAVALAGTVFFDVPIGEARGRVALYLGLTLLPFALLVPVAGPLLDHFRHGRRNVIAAADGGRGLVAWSLAGSLASLSLYPQALAILIMARAYGVARAAAVVRVRPPALGLVAANARMNIAATASAGTAAAVGVGISALFGSAWVLRLAALLLIAGAVVALHLPAQIDEARPSGAKRGRKYRLRDAPGVVRRPLIAVVSLRVLAGLLTIDLAFLLRAQGASGAVIGVVLGAALAGGLLGTILASKLHAERTAKLTGAALIAPAIGCLLAALTGLTALQALAVSLTGLAASLAKYALDASLQTHVPPAAVSGAFARSETALQLGWAFGGAVGLALSMADKAGIGDRGAVALCFAVATALPVAGLILRVRWPAPTHPEPTRRYSAPYPDPRHHDPRDHDPRDHHPRDREVRDELRDRDVRDRDVRDRDVRDRDRDGDPRDFDPRDPRARRGPRDGDAPDVDPRDRQDGRAGQVPPARSKPLATSGPTPDHPDDRPWWRR